MEVNSPLGDRDGSNDNQPGLRGFIGSAAGQISFVGMMGIQVINCNGNNRTRHGFALQVRTGKSAQPTIHAGAPGSLPLLPMTQNQSS
jgi:hypothetical protein